VALQRLARGKVFRPNFPWNDEGYADLSLIRPFNHSRSCHVHSSFKTIPSVAHGDFQAMADLSDIPFDIAKKTYIAPR
jgi:hypothetical protein